MKGLFVGLAAILALPGTAQAAAFVNGDFESGIETGSDFVTLNSTGVDGWTVLSGTIDYIGGYWTAGSGSRSIDLNGSSAAVLAQTFDTIAGLTYTVEFLLAGNPVAGGPALKILEVAASGNAAQQYTFDTTGYSQADMGWTNQSYIFTAGSDSTTLSFSSLTEGQYYGPALDGVSLTALPVPEPATWAMLFAGFALIGGAMRRRQQVVQFS